ncbi:uncharacterized protein [Magallana gigas]|uniref:uncharacterized protein isoform X3 n=1 Tax=Magallana gigas TaxID=29159 RepID=UPI00148AA30C|nr:uncharacterized protein LOC105324906 isoform X2 [Crassostrea gigas]XP_034313594.1 uncharacterized protein LOC117684664 isoform X3 [Crassostrea gigas]
MVQPVVLKKRHSLKGLTLLPVIRKVKDGQLENVKELARISVGKRTEALQLRDIAKAVMEITGEPMDELLELAGKDIRDCDAAKLLLHYCVLAANERGQPKGQVLQDDEAGPSTSGAPAERQNQTEDNTVENEATPVKKRKTIDDMERRLLMLEKLEKEDVSKVGSVDVQVLDERLKELDARRSSSLDSKRQDCLKREITEFLVRMSGRELTSCTPDDIRRFLVWKDQCGKSQVHKIDCRFLGNKGLFDCNCPVRLASGTVSLMINRLVNIFHEMGCERSWNMALGLGNPAASSQVKDYLKIIQEEQARAHLVPKQAKPIFLTKVKAIVGYIGGRLSMSSVSVRERYILLRDQAWFKLQFFAGDRAGDLANLVAQEVKWLRDYSGFVFNHTFGKTLRGGKRRSNMFVVKRCDDKVICPVVGLQDFVSGCKDLGVDLSCGYLFRVVTEGARVLDQPVSYSVVYDRLRVYLRKLGADEGETPHSFRAGCAVTLAMSGSVSEVGQIMRHVGWFGEGSAEYYSRLPALVESDFVAGRLATSVKDAGMMEEKYRECMQYDSLDSAFVESE